MALIIEDGSIVASANSYNTLSELNSYLSARVITLYQEDGTTELTDAQKEALLIESFDYLNNEEDKYVGSRVAKAQTGSWPRQNVYINGFSYLSTEIPDIVKTVQLAITTESGQGIDIYNSGATIKSEKKEISGAVSKETEYMGGKVAVIRESTRLILQLYRRGGGYSIPLYR